MGSKITIIGAGSVGSTIAHILSLKPYVSELVMIDILKDKADGEIMDMAQGTGFRDQCCNHEEHCTSGSKACTECTVHHRSKSGRCTDLCILKVFRNEGESGNWFWYTA